MKTQAEAEALVSIGDPAVYDQSFELINGSVGVARAFDDKAGAYAVLEAIRRLAEAKDTLQAKVIGVATTQEEIGTRGAITAAHSENPDRHRRRCRTATDSPDCDNRKYGKFLQGGGPIICKGPNINPIVFEKLESLAKAGNIPYQIEADAWPTGTDARAIQVAQSGIATGLLSILRYMHTPSEMVDLQDIEHNRTTPRRLCPIPQSGRKRRLVERSGRAYRGLACETARGSNAPSASTGLN